MGQPTGKPRPASSVGRKKTQTNLSNHIDPNVNCCAMVSRGMAVACVPWGCQVGLPAMRRKLETHGQHATSSSKPEGLGGRACALALVWWWACPMGMAQGALHALASMVGHTCKAKTHCQVHTCVVWPDPLPGRAAAGRAWFNLKPDPVDWHACMCACVCMFPWLHALH